MTGLFKRRRRSGPVFFLILFGAVVFGLIFLLDMTLRHTFFNIAEAKAVQLATESFQKALQREVADENLQYQDFIVIQKDNQGHIVLMQADTVKVNRFSANTTLAVQKALEELRWQSLSIPAGQILGIPFLAHLGPQIKYHIMPVGTVRVNVVDKFESAGINQTKHTIYLNFDTNIRIVVPLKSGETIVANQVPLAESIIVGSVPSTFVTLPSGIFNNGLIK
ncbi:sporulation protein YunB [Pelotomaculum propionicicum]|uniref:sporulation protein YunB n=1 Tax=Pelotomaculum propionicicum TaxID=258475 RepID=UPI001FAA032C|nr:sporulation protein YunB [Pelotomaculum propionicicum]